MRIVSESDVLKTSHLADDHIYYQDDDVAMGSPVGTLFAGIYMAKLNIDLVESSIHTLYSYKRNVDDIFCSVNASTRISQLLDRFNSSHPNVKFTTQIELNFEIGFLDVEKTVRFSHQCTEKPREMDNTFTFTALHLLV